MSFGLLCSALGAVSSVGCGPNEAASVASPESRAPPAATASVEEVQAQSALRQTTPLDEAAVDTRRLDIEAEVAKLGPEHPWAGQYKSLGTDTTKTILIAPNAGFVRLFSSPGTSGKAVPLRSGSVRVVGDMLVLDADFVARNATNEPDKYVPIHWGSRRYLVPDTRMIDFCNDVNLGHEEFAIGRSWLACRDPERKKATGKPELPEPYRSYILDEPITARIASVVRTATQDPKTSSDGITLVVDVGRNRGVFEGMLFCVVEPKVRGTFRVTSVRETDCDAKEISHQDSSRYVVGIELCTRPRAH